MKRAGHWYRVVSIAGFILSSPVVWAQPLEVADVDTTRAAVDLQVERLVTEVAARDPELAQEIERQSELCIRDFSDGRLDHEGFTRDVENFREAREMMEQMMGGEMPAGEGEHAGPTPEMMERMSQGMEQLMAEHPEMAEYARAEFGEMMKDFAEHQMGSPEGMERADMERMAEMFRDMSPEHMAEMAERFGHEGFEHGPFDPREFERYGHEFEREFFEREFGARLDELAQHFLEGAPPGPGEHVLVEAHTVAEHGHAEGHWDGPDPDNLADHTHPLGTAPHTN